MHVNIQNNFAVNHPQAPQKTTNWYKYHIVQYNSYSCTEK